MYCKSNVRRVINYTQTEPINKYDLWLSENARYNEDGELEYDNDGQPACDLILKLFRHGRWEPIVGFNTTALNKINTVDGVSYTPTGSSVPKIGKHEFHPAIFTKDTPGELYDAGTLGELLSDTNFVNSDEWQDLFNTQQFQDAFNTFVINGGNYDWDDIITSDIDFATTTRIGGIYSDIQENILDVHNAFKAVECAFYPNYSLYSSKQGRLCVNAHDIKQALNDIDKDLYEEDPASELIVNGWKGVQTEMRENHNGVWVRANVQNVELGTPPVSLSITNSTINGQEDSIIITGTNYEKVVGPYEVFDYSTTIDEYSFNFSQIQSFQNTNPIYLKIAFKYPITFTSGTQYICDSLINNEVPGGKYIVTIQFGVVKFEKINTFSNT